MSRLSVISHLLYKTPPDIKWPGLSCPMCHGPVEHTEDGWVCGACEAGWDWGGIAGTWVEPARPVGRAA